ncbi:hypothetical protein quinque_009804 [Culex quinquefasciatus]
MEAIGVQNVVDYGTIGREDADGDPGFSFRVNTSAFSAEDFYLFVNSLEQTYTTQQHKSLVEQVDDRDDDRRNSLDSLYEALNFADGVSGYEASDSADSIQSSSSLESLVQPDVPYNSMVIAAEQPVVNLRPSLGDLFKYFEKDVTIDSEDELDAEPINLLPSPPPTPARKPAIKQPPSTTPKPPGQVGRLNANLLRIFESEAQQPPKNNRSATMASESLRKAPIIRNQIDDHQPAVEPQPQPRKKVDNDSFGGQRTPPDAKTTAAMIATPPPSAVKIVNTTRKVVGSSNRSSISSSCSSNYNTVNRDKCYVRSINDLFLQYRLDQQQVEQAIQHIEKKKPADPTPAVPMEIISSAVPVADDPVKTRKKPDEETAQQIHFRLQNQTYRLEMRSLIESQAFVHMTAAHRNQLFHLDKIFNRSNLSLIHMVLSLIREHVLLMGDRVTVELTTTNYDRFVATMSAGSYGIDSMATRPVRENCVSVEVLAVDLEGGGKEKPTGAVKIVILFVIETVTDGRDAAAKKGKKTMEGGCEEEFPRQDGGDYQITVRMRFEPPENELQKSHETGTNLSEHQLRVQASLQRLNIPDWYKQYSTGKDGGHPNNPNAPQAPPGTCAGTGILRKRNSDVGRWTGLSSKTTSLSSLGSHRSDRSPVMLSPSAHSHTGGQTGFSRWSTSHLNSNQTSPSVSTRGSFTRGGLNASVISGYSTASTTVGATAAAGGAPGTIRNSFRQPYLGWRSQEKLSQPRTPAERLASSLLSQQKAKEQQHQHHHQNQKSDPVVTPEIQSSIKEVTSAIVHYVNDQTNRHSRSRSTSPSQRCWLESSFVGTRPLDSPQTPMIEGQNQQQHQSQLAGDHYRYNAGRMNGVASSPTSAAAIVPTFSLPPDQQSPGSATLEDVLASLLGLPAESHRSSASSNHTLQIEQVQTRRRSEGDASRRQRNDSGSGSVVNSVASNSIVANANASANSRRVSLDSCDTATGASSVVHGKGHTGGEILKCRYPKCDAVATIAEARKSYKSCHNCSHLYCSRECRRAHWERHRKACLHSRISALCRLVLSTCKDDADTLRHLSVLARRGYLSQGRGVVRILFRSPENADSFIKQGFQCLGEVSYVRWPDLLPAEMGPELYSELLKLATEYKPDSKMLIYVAICVVSEAPGNATAPVKWERQLVSRCAKLKLCRSVLSEISNSPEGSQRPNAKKEPTTEVLILTFNILSKTTQRARELVSQNIQTVLRQRGVILRKHYPEVFQRLATFVEGSTDRFLPVTLHPRDNATGRAFVCILMPNYGGDADKLQFPISENSDDDERVVTMDVGAGDLSSGVATTTVPMVIEVVEP